jgi:hypothetical protein
MEKQKATEVLASTKEEDKIVCLYSNPYSNKFIAGFVEAISENHVVLRHLTTHGSYDGWRLVSLEDCCRIDFGGRYEETLLALFHARGQSHPNFLPTTDESSDLVRCCMARSEMTWQLPSAQAPMKITGDLSKSLSLPRSPSRNSTRTDKVMGKA